MIKKGYRDRPKNREIWKQFINREADYDDYMKLESWLNHDRKHEISTAILGLTSTLKDHRNSHYNSLKKRFCAT